MAVFVQASFKSLDIGAQKSVLVRLQYLSCYDWCVCFTLIAHSNKEMIHSKWFEPRSVSSSYSVIVQVSVVLKRTVVGD